MASQWDKGLEGMDAHTLRSKAWLGDAVLALYARLWLSAQGRALDAAAFTRMTSNHFLATLGAPTKVEARIGLTYEQNGLEAAFELITRELLPRFEAQEANRRP